MSSGAREMWDELEERARISAAERAASFAKHDAGKSRLELLPPRAMELVGYALGHGAKKYAPGNWRRVDDLTRYWGAALRHVFAHMRGERLDQECGLPHLALAVCSLLFVIELEEEKSNG